MSVAGVALLGISYDAGSSFLRGSATGPSAIREALWTPAGNSWSENGLDLNEAALVDEGDLRFEEGEPGETARRRIEAAITRLGGSGRAPLVLGGDHSITYPVLRGLRRYQPKLTVLHLDAHPDLYDEFEGNRYSHACPFARVMEERLADRLVQVGIRTMNGHQRSQARRFGVEVLEMRNGVDPREPGLEGPVYISLDLDVLEPGLAPGVSHREPGGLTVREVLTLIQGCGGWLVGADVVELNPVNDPAGITAAVAAKLVKELAGRMLE